MAVKFLPAQGAIGTNGLIPAYFDSTAGTPVAQRLTVGTIATGDQFEIPNQGQTVLLFKNAATPAVDVVIQSKATLGGLAVADRTVIVPADGDLLVGPFPQNVYGDVLTIAIETVTATSLAIMRMA